MDERHAPDADKAVDVAASVVYVMQVEPWLHACHGPPGLLLTSWRPEPSAPREDSASNRKRGHTLSVCAPALRARHGLGRRKYIGWGWRITSWEGLLITAIFALLLVSSIVIWRDSRLFPIAVLVVLYVVVVLLTGDPPGGPTRRTDSEVEDVTR